MTSNALESELVIKTEEKGPFLSELFSALPYLEGGKVQYIEGEDGDLLVRKPLHIDETPLAFDKWAHLDFGEHQKLMTRDQIKAYFEGELIDARIKMVEGVPGESYGWAMSCDYCRFPIPIGEYFYCTDCHKDMCSLCHSETNEEIALKNGAKNYALRKEALQTCQQEHILTTQKWFNSLQVSCDVCSEESTDGQKLYYVNIGEGFLQDTVDICETCWKSEETSEALTTEHGGRDKFKHRVKVRSSMDCVFFGSLLDWVPILRDECYHTVLININAESALFGKFAAFCVDDHGRCGYFVLHKVESVETLSVALKAFEDDPEWIESQGWERHYNFPIVRLMHETYGCPFHFG